MATIPTEAQARLKHLMENIIEIDMTDDLVLALAHSGFTDLDQMGMMITEDIERLC